MRLIRDLSTLFAVLVALGILLWPQTEMRPLGTFLLGVAIILLVFLLVAITQELERLHEKVEELESWVKE
jgi:phosphoglycerol transferase MdoB-like AlkP superfamily enzyme